MDFTVDTRTATEYGVVRTFADMVFTWTGGEYVGAGALGSHAPGVRRLTTARPAPLAAPQLGLYHAFIQFAGFTFGRTISIFDAPWQSYPAGGPDTLPGGSNHVYRCEPVHLHLAQFWQWRVGKRVALQDPTLQDTHATSSNTSYCRGRLRSSAKRHSRQQQLRRHAGAPGCSCVMVSLALIRPGVCSRCPQLAHDNHVCVTTVPTETTGHPR